MWITNARVYIKTADGAYVVMYRVFPIPRDVGTSRQIRLGHWEFVQLTIKPCPLQMPRV